ncbi:hypothetical protein GCM10027047_33980 [Rhodococcus aerolatus]
MSSSEPAGSRPPAERPGPPPRRPAPERPAFSPSRPDLGAAPPTPRVVSAARGVVVLGIAVSALAAAVVAANLDPVRSRLEVGLALDNPDRSLQAVTTAVRYTLLGTLAAAVVVAVVQLVAVLWLRRRSRAALGLLVGAAAVNLVTLVVTGALLADAQVGASSGQLRLVGLAPMLHGVLLVVAVALLLLPESRAWLRRPTARAAG